MNLKHSLLLGALSAPALCALLAPADKVSFHPAKGTKLARTWEVKTQLSLDDQTTSMNGKPTPDIDMEMEISGTMEFVLHDEFGELDGERPKLVRRTYDKLSSGSSFAIEMAMMPDGGMEKNMTGSSKLEGKTVDFTWNADEEKYDVAYHDSEGEADLLEGLAEDLDLRAFLPGKEVAAGDTWKIDPNTFKQVLQPGGNLKIRPNLDADDEEAMGMMGMGMDDFQDMSRMIGDSMEGDVQGEYKGSREADGATVGEIHVTFKLSSANDATEMVKKMLKAPSDQIESLDIDHMDMEFTYEGDGTILWDLAAGHVHSLELSGEMAIKQDTGMTVGVQGRKMSIESTASLSGSTTHRVTVTKD
jgi:hypothetical protein